MIRPAFHAIEGVVLAILISASIATHGQAQVVFDGTLRPGNDGNAPPFFPAVGEYVVDEALGITAGTNLFHSFRELSLGEDDVLRFTGSASIENLIARVTGGQKSVIAGVIRSDLPNANLFLMNRAGIELSSPDGVARDPILTQGSFFASTASRLDFADGSFFSAMGGEDASLIVSEPSAWGFAAGGNGTITARQTFFLAVPDGETLNLTASEIVVTSGSTLSATGGEIELAAVGDAAVDVPLDLDSFTIDGLDGNALGEIRIDAGATLRTGVDGGSAGDLLGQVIVRGGSLIVSESSLITSSGRPTPDTNAIDIELSRDFSLESGARIESVSTQAQGPGGIRVQADRIDVDEAISEITIRGLNGAEPGSLRLDANQIEVSDQASVTSQAFGATRGAEIEINAESLIVRDGALIETSTTGAGRAGDLNAGLGDNDDSFVLTGGGQVGSVTTGAGDGGDVSVIAAGSTRIEGAGVRGTDAVPSLLFARSGRGPGGQAFGGDAGSLDLEARTVEMTGASAISGRSFGPGSAGIVTVTASDSITLAGDETGAPEISARTVNGDGGGVETDEPGLVIRTGQLEIRDGAAISTSSSGKGRGADLLIEADTIHLSSADGLPSAGIFSEALAFDTGDFQPGEGDTGEIRLDVNDLDVERGGEISIETEGPGAGQRIEIEANETVRIAGGVIRSNASALATAPAGDISIQADQDVEITDGGLVTAESTSLFVGGAADAGSIVIDAGRSLNVKSATIRTSSDNTAGGQIELNASKQVLLRNSEVETSVRGGIAASDAGNVDIAAQVVVLDESNVLARAVVGDGGDISIRSSVLLLSAGSSLDASSDLGISGKISTTAPDNNLLDGLTQLPSEFQDSTALLGERCASRDRETGSFVVGGRTGLAASPARALSIPVPLREDDGASDDASPQPMYAVSGSDPCRPARDDFSAHAGGEAR